MEKSGLRHLVKPAGAVSDVRMSIQTKVEGRRRSYILTEKGKEMLEKECARLTAQLNDYHMIFGKEEA